MNVVVNSFGACGSKFLTKQIVKNKLAGSFSDVHQHIRSVSDANEQSKYIFLFADPIDAVISFFCRQIHNTEQHGFNGLEGKGDILWPSQHCQNIGGSYEFFENDWKLIDYLKVRTDLFLLEAFFDNWFNNKLTNKVMFIRYEKIWDYKLEIANFINADDAFVSNFEEQKPRTSRNISISNIENDLLSEIYGNFRTKINKLNDVFYI